LLNSRKTTRTLSNPVITLAFPAPPLLLRLHIFTHVTLRQFQRRMAADKEGCSEVAGG
jgi:hypothetical protein